MMDIFLTGLAASAAAAREAAEQAQRASHISQTTNLIQSDVVCLRDEVERLSLLNQAMWELLRERLRLSDDDLEKKAQEVDMRDGKPDGKMSRHPLRCPQCGRVTNSRHKKCLYCGLEFQGDIFG